MNVVKFFIVFVPLAVLLVVGGMAGLLADVFEWIDETCREWFDEIYGIESDDRESDGSDWYD